MNRFLITLTLFICFLFSGNAQTLLIGDIFINSQSQIDNFSTTYPNIAIVDGELKIYGEGAPSGDRITDLSGLSQVTAVTEDLKIYYCPELMVLAGLENLLEVGGDLDIYHVGISNAMGLTSLQSIGGSLWFEDNYYLSSLSGLENLTTIDSNLVAGLNPVLANFNGLSGLSFLGGHLEIYENALFPGPDGLDQLTSIGGDLYIYDNPILNSLQALGPIQEIGGDLIIAFNPLLDNLISLSNLKKIGSDLEIYCNDSLTSLTGLENLDFIPGNLSIACLHQISSLKGLNAITGIVGNVSIQTNSNLVSLSGLNAVKAIGGQISIWNNERLANLTGLEGVTAIGGFLKIYDNPVLVSLEGIDNINHTDITYLYLVDNDSLSHCEVESICRFFNDPEGTVVIHGNKEGCNSNLEITEACEGLFPDPVHVPGDYILYPNPAQDQVTLQVQDDKTVTNLRIFNDLGQCILKVDLPDGEINVAPLPAGVYLLKFEISGQEFTDRLVIW